MKLPNSIGIMTKAIKPFAAAFALLLFLSGCSVAVPVGELLIPPKLTDEQQEIYQALLNGKGSDITLKYPKSGDYRSAFVFGPPEFGSDNRVMVFYENTGLSGEPALWLTLLIRRNNRWECTYDLSFFATDIEKVEFSAFGESEEITVIISCSVKNQPDIDIDVLYISDDDPPVMLREETCVYYSLGDFNGDGETELFLIKKDRNTLLSSAVILTRRGDDEELVAAGTVTLNPEALEYVKVTEGQLKTENDGAVINALFLEYLKGDNITYNTDIIYWYNNSLINAVYSLNEQRRATNTSFLEKRPNAYTMHAYSRDIDGDGIIEAAGNKSFPGYSDDTINTSDRVRATIWFKLKGRETLERLYYTYFSINSDFIFVFPARWEERVTVTMSPDGREVVFWEYNEKKHATIHDVEKELLRITVVPKTESADFADENPDSQLFKGTSGVISEPFDYYIKRENAGELAITGGELNLSLFFF